MKLNRILDIQNFKFLFHDVNLSFVQLEQCWLQDVRPVLCDVGFTKYKHTNMDTAQLRVFGTVF